MKQKLSPTLQMFGALDLAFDHFNHDLFDGELPTCIITVARKRGAYGYFWADVFKENKNGGEARMGEICLNPDMMDRELPVVISTLVHEMAHHWQQCNGTPGKNGYHNTEWAKKMVEIGLNPISKTKSGTGKRVAHEIVEGGRFAKAYARMSNVSLDWASVPKLREVKPPTRHRLVCPKCDQTIWGTDKNNIVCGNDDTPMEKEE